MQYLVTSSLSFEGIEAQTINSLEQRGFVVRRTFSLHSAAGSQHRNDPSPGYSVLLLYDPQAQHQAVGLITLYERGGQTVIKPVMTHRPGSAQLSAAAVEDAHAELVAALVSGGLAFCADAQERGDCRMSGLAGTDDH